MAADKTGSNYSGTVASFIQQVVMLKSLTERRHNRFVKAYHNIKIEVKNIECAKLQ
jgi:hypothetical protein